MAASGAPMGTSPPDHSSFLVLAKPPDNSVPSYIMRAVVTNRMLLIFVKCLGNYFIIIIWVQLFLFSPHQASPAPPILHCWWECRLVKPLWKTVWNFLRKLKMELPFDPAIPLLGLYLKEPKTLIQKDLCTPMFIAVHFTIAKYWKQPKCPSVNEWPR